MLKPLAPFRYRKPHALHILFPTMLEQSGWVSVRNHDEEGDTSNVVGEDDCT